MNNTKLMNACKTLKNKKFKIKCIWKKIPEFENYAVSNLGEVKNLKTGIILKPYLNSSGYCMVRLYNDGCGRFCLVHRLVANAFIPNLKNLPEVNHKDEVKTNNRVDNLEFCDRRYNAEYSFAMPVICVETGMIYKSLMEASRQTGVNGGNICNVLKGRLRTAGGFHWQYVLN